MKKLILCLCFLGIASPSMADRSDNNEIGYIERIENLESQMEKQKRAIEKLEKRVGRINQKLGLLIKTLSATGL